MSTLAGLLGRWLGRLSRSAPAAWRSVLGHLAGPAAFSTTGVEIARELGPERVLVLAPHPDDEIIGPGGTLIRHLEVGGEVTVVYMTDGGAGGDDDELVRTRRREAEAVGRELGLEQVFWTHPDTRLDPGAAEPELRRLLARLRPEAVYVTSYFEHHYDHYAANATLARALEACGVEPSVRGYEVWDNLPAPNWVVDVTAQLERKIEAMATYETPMLYTDFAELFRHRGALHYLLHIDSGRAEPEGSAEAFLRSSAREFCGGFARWDARLREAGSPLPTHLDEL